MLSFFATCGACGRQLTAAGGAGKKCSNPIYRCPGGCVHIRADWLDDYVSMTVIERLSRPDAYPLTVAASDKEAVAARTEAAELRARLDEHADLSAEGKISAAQPFPRMRPPGAAASAAAGAPSRTAKRESDLGVS